MPTLLLALVAGLLTAIIVGRATSPRAAEAPARVGGVADVEGVEGPVGAALPVPNDDLATALREAQALRDGAEALTRAEVELDERAVELWLPRLSRIDEALAALDSTPAVRAELEAARRALLRLGIGGVDADFTAP